MVVWCDKPRSIGIEKHIKAIGILIIIRSKAMIKKVPLKRS